MKLLLDTHVLIWILSAGQNLSPSQGRAIEDAGNELYLSAASAWEIGIKVAKGQLQMKRPIGTVMEKLGLTELPISIAHAVEAADLPPLHRDPFDRLLIAQARLEGMALVTSDAAVRQYPVTCI